MSATTVDQARAAAATGAPVREVLTLRLGAEEYGVDILRAPEIRSFEPPTRIAGAPAHALGVTTLRGVIVPIVDLRCRLGLEPIHDAVAVTVVLSIAGRTIGAVADAVSDVVALAPAEVKPAPAFSGAVDARHITGIGMVGEGPSARMLIPVAVESLISGAEIGLAAETVH